ncbi:MAG: class I SAM-dependent methyltransferase [Solirubrobacteraceae bacterium]|mgnify:CR=1 FL=1|nr:class I SAM-dependent methyltransferase [Solirubrobacteraceae bacterium]
MTAASVNVIWHDVECGAYDADLPLWRELSEGVDGPVLDVGAGTGRVALDLARRGRTVIALDADPDLLAALRERAGRLPVRTVCADARDFALDEEVALVIVPMQTLQLLGGPEGRRAFLRCAARHLRPGGLLAAALADATDGAPPGDEPLGALPDIREVDGTVYASHPVGLRREDGGVVIQRIREVVDPRGGRTTEGNEIRLDDLDPATVEAEAAPLGFEPRPPRAVAATDEYVGSEVVVLCRR